MTTDYDTARHAALDALPSDSYAARMNDANRIATAQAHATLALAAAVREATWETPIGLVPADGAEEQQPTRMATVSAEQVHRAAEAACRAVWKAAFGGAWDTECPARERWIREELEALLPALAALGISVTGDQHG